MNSHIISYSKNIANPVSSGAVRAQCFIRMVGTDDTSSYLANPKLFGDIACFVVSAALRASPQHVEIKNKINHRKRRHYYEDKKRNYFISTSKQ